LNQLTLSLHDLTLMRVHSSINCQKYYITDGQMERRTDGWTDG